uniref:Uncharacterized protein n=1 Tax=Micrurus paraensis TaxID=1970185 RepID=A0A2D4K6D4_9SAUR
MTQKPFMSLSERQMSVNMHLDGVKRITEYFPNFIYILKAKVRQNPKHNTKIHNSMVQNRRSNPKYRLHTSKRKREAGLFTIKCVFKQFNNLRRIPEASNNPCYSITNPVTPEPLKSIDSGGVSTIPS